MKRRKVSIKFTQPSLTKQSFAKEADINNIMSKYEKTGIVEHVMSSPGQFGDFSEPLDYQEALNKINAAQSLFDALPAQVRQKFENDPALFLEFAQNPENYDKLVSMGLAVAPETPETASQAPETTNPPDEQEPPQNPANAS